MEKYRRVRKPRESGDSAEDIIKITAKGKASTYVTYASKLFNEKELDACTLKATGIALSTAVTVGEVLKRRFKGLHQIVSIGTLDIVDEWEPLEEGLEKVTSKRGVSFIEILLSKKELDTSNVGYQAPLPESEVVERDDVANPARKEKGGKRKKGSGKKGKDSDSSGKGSGKKGKKGKGKKGKGKKGSKGSGKKGKKGSKGKKGKGKKDD